MSAGHEPADQTAATVGRFERAISGMEDQFFMLDAQWRYVLINPRVTEFLGRPAADLIGRSIWELFPHLVGSQFHQVLHEVARNQESRRFEMYSAARGRWLENTVLPTDDGIAVIVRDITRRKRLEEALQRNERLLALSQAIAHLGSWVLEFGEHSGKDRVWWSDETFRIFGYEPGEIEPSVESFLGRVHPDDRTGTRERLEASRHEGDSGTVEDEYRIVRPDGERTIHTWREPVFGPGGEITGLFGTLQDVTEQKYIEHALKEADRRKDEFLATLAHELRNPLAPILNAVQFLHLRGSTDPDVLRAREMIERQVHHMVRLVNDLLDVSRITLGRIKLQLERVDLRTLISTAVESSQPLMESSHHQFTMVLPEEPIHVRVDPTRLSQVLLNLLDNAAKYTPQGGRIQLKATQNENEAMICVADNGIGISPEMLPRIFEMFAQVQEDGSRTPGQGGLGIGLTLAQRLVQLHGGWLEARSEGLGLGSEFIIHLPITRERERIGNAEDTGQGKAPGMHRRVLIVDDNIDAAESLSMNLRLIGHDVHTVYSGTAAIEVAPGIAPEIVLLDIGLPDVDGYEVARQLRRAPGGQQLVLVALTGWGQEEDKRRAIAAGFDYHLTKPVDLSFLELLLQRARRR